MTPVRVLKGGKTNVVKAVTSYFQATVGNSQVEDLRITDSGKVTICDYLLDDLFAQLGTRFVRCVIQPEPSSGAPPAPAGVATPSKVYNAVLEILKFYAQQNLIDYDACVSGLIVQLDPVVPTRIDISLPIYTAFPLHTITVDALQSS